VQQLQHPAGRPEFACSLWSPLKPGYILIASIDVVTLTETRVGQVLERERTALRYIQSKYPHITLAMCRSPDQITRGAPRIMHVPVWAADASTAVSSVLTRDATVRPVKSWPKSCESDD
jgi:hypothetical protein